MDQAVLSVFSVALSLDSLEELTTYQDAVNMKGTVRVCGDLNVQWYSNQCTKSRAVSSSPAPVSYFCALTDSYFSFQSLLIPVQVHSLSSQKMQYTLQREINTVATADTNRNSSEGNKPDTMESFRSFHSHLNAPKTGKKKRKVR